ncbi:hypothetical protein L7F22_028822 [Adiantum nelumboides]|nr:hypothetical protein [Adiantum nelumboides]
MDRDRIAYRELQTSLSMALTGDASSWYAQTSEWFTKHGLDIDRLPPLQYDIHAPTYTLTHQERNRIIRQEISHIYIERTWFSPRQPLQPKMLHYHEHFLQISDQGFIDTPQYMQQYMPHHLRVAIGQLRVSSHQLEIERGRARGIPRENRTCSVCQTEHSAYVRSLHDHDHMTLEGTVLEEELSTKAEAASIRAARQAGFRCTYSTIDHIFTLRCLIDQARVRKKRLYCCFVEFCKAFDTVPRERLFRRLLSLGLEEDLIWGIYALYEQVCGRVQCPGGTTETLFSTIGVKQGCPLSPTLFGLYIDEIVDFIQHRGGDGLEMGGTTVHIHLYADDIVLISESAEGLRQHLLGLDDFCAQEGLSVNLGKTKVLIFHTSTRIRRESSFTATEGPQASVATCRQAKPCVGPPLSVACALDTPEAQMTWLASLLVDLKPLTPLMLPRMKACSSRASPVGHIRAPSHQGATGVAGRECPVTYASHRQRYST